MLVSLCSACLKPVATLSSESPKHSLYPSWSGQWRQFLGDIPLSQLPHRGAGPVTISFSFFCSAWLCVILPAASIVWDLLVFSRYSLRAVPRVDVFLMYLWEEVSSMFCSSLSSVSPIQTFISSISFFLYCLFLFWLCTLGVSGSVHQSYNFASYPHSWKSSMEVVSTQFTRTFFWFQSPRYLVSSDMRWLRQSSYSHSLLQSIY